MDKQLDEQDELKDAQKYSHQVVATSSIALQNLNADDRKLLNEQKESTEQKLRDNLSLKDFTSKNVCPELQEPIAKRSEIRRDDGYECNDDDKDVVIRQLRNGCDIHYFDQNEDILNLPDQLENIIISQISSEEVLGDKVSGKIKIDSETSVNLITSTHKSTFKNTCDSSVIPSAGHNIEITKSEKTNKEQNLKPNMDETPTEYKKGATKETDRDEEAQHNHHHAANSQNSEQHRLSGPQQSSAEIEPTTRIAASNAADILRNDGLTITRSLSLSSQKTGIPLKAQSLDSRPIYPNVPYSPYASPYSSPRSNRRRPPLRESRRVSIEQSGSFLQLNQYKLMDQIGQGSYGLVKLAYSEEDSTHYAMKILSKRRLLRQAGLAKRGPKKSTSPLDRVYREIAVLKKLDHPNVVKLIEVLDDPMEDSLYMVFELVTQGEVLSVPTKNPLSEGRAWSVFRDTLLGLEYLHYQRIVHADIKPGNLLLTECGRVKIADLGVCNEFIGEDATMTNSTAGTPAFRAPETLNVGQNIYCGKAADVWALGATLYALVFGNVPFVAPSIPALYEKIKIEELSFPQIPKTSAELRDCIQSMLKKHPADRITVPQLKEHAWVTAGGQHLLPSEEENCRLVQVDDDDINSVVRSIPKLDTLILIKTMLKKHSFGNPFSRGISGRAPQRGGSRLERFIRAGRSNSAPGSYNMILDRQLSGDNILPALCEHSPSNCTNDESQ